MVIIIQVNILLEINLTTYKCITKIPIEDTNIDTDTCTAKFIIKNFARWNDAASTRC